MIDIFNSMMCKLDKLEVLLKQKVELEIDLEELREEQIEILSKIIESKKRNTVRV